MNAPPISNKGAEIPITRSGSVRNNRMPRGTINPAPEAYKLFELGGEIFPKDEAISGKATFCTCEEEVLREPCA